MFSEKYRQQYGVHFSTWVLDDRQLGDVERYQFEKVMLLLGNVIEKIATEELGKASLKLIAKIHIDTAEKELRVVKQSNKMVVRCNLEHNLDLGFENILKETQESNLKIKPIGSAERRVSKAFQ